MRIRSHRQLQRRDSRADRRPDLLPEVELLRMDLIVLEIIGDVQIFRERRAERGEF